MLFKPSDTKPHITPINATISNTFSCNIEAEGGVEVTKYNLFIKDKYGSSVYTSGITTLTEYLYNQDTLNITVPSTSGMINGIEYIWNITLYENNPTIWITYGTVQSVSTTTNIYIRIHDNVSAGMHIKIGNETRQISTYNISTGLAVVSTAFSIAPTVGYSYMIYSDNITSDDIYFKTRSMPTISINNFQSLISEKSYTFTGLYSQSDNITWKYYTFILYDNNDNIIGTTGTMTGGEIEYTFDGFLNGGSYKIELNIEDQDEVYLSTGKLSFNVSYNSISVSNISFATDIASKNAISVTWDLPYKNESSVIGSTYPYYEYVENEPYDGATSINIYKDTIISYSIGTQDQLSTIPYESASFIHFKLPVGFSGNIFSMYNSSDGSIYSISYDDGMFTTRINDLYVCTTKIHESNKTCMFASSYTPYAKYVWDDSFIWDDSLMLYTQKEDIINESWTKAALFPTYSVIYQYPYETIDGGNASSIFIDTIDGGTASSTFDDTIYGGYADSIYGNKYPYTVIKNEDGKAPTEYDKIYLYGNQLVDYMFVSKNIPSSSNIDIISNFTYRPEWSLGNIAILCNFDNTLYGGNMSSDIDTIEAWGIYRKKYGESTQHFVLNVDYTVTEIIDYNVSNNESYMYNVFPLTSTKVASPMPSEYISTCWNNWQIFGIIEQSTDYSSDYGKYFYVDTDNIWQFMSNINIGTTEQNIDKTKLESLSKYPSISSGTRNYSSGTVSCLIGSISNSLYTDSVLMINNFKDFVCSSNKKILKDPKGNMYMVDIMSNSFNILDTYYTQPTSISFSWVEIGTTENITITEETEHYLSLF